ncbi:pyridoxamine 5'-phosphate oxidase family protein [Natrinema halophilum]|uniref:pyridoxamine 5'-phosphate oxidase family protein n=1 Tax=Natrinema halophilum TaxID=1699371 RepID=UPI001F15D0A0|nr:pyridoxamine 5'-phosphate oxidase family protein [Natrinema halophilum]UHQ96083.1 pyridoxamine 5'-phosphate oxidase family protein [Natrinema halophilum]
MPVDKLSDYGIDRMDDDQIHGFLSSQSVGVLGLPAEGAPSMRPLSFWYDGESRVYFVYVRSTENRKEELSDRADTARFLVYRQDTPFNWTSVLLTGPIENVPESERDAVEDAIEMRWRPDVFEQASSSENVKLYQFRIEDQVGIRQMGLPPEFETDSTDDRSE